MGHRAIVAYQRESGTYDCYYSHWGAVDLCLKDPLGDGLAPGETYKRDPSLPVQHNDISINPDPIPDAEEKTPPEIALEVVEYWQHKAVYVVPAIGDVEAYVTLDFDLDADGARSTHDGALVAPGWFEGEPLTQRIAPRFEGWKDVYTDLVESEERKPGEAKAELERRVFSKWGKPSARAEIPEWSPRGHTPAQGLRSLSDRVADMEAAITDPDR